MIRRARVGNESVILVLNLQAKFFESRCVRHVLRGYKGGDMNEMRWFKETALERAVAPWSIYVFTSVQVT